MSDLNFEFNRSPGNDLESEFNLSSGNDLDVINNDDQQPRNVCAHIHQARPIEKGLV